jgi:hypothetical protein
VIVSVSPNSAEKVSFFFGLVEPVAVADVDEPALVCAVEEPDDDGGPCCCLSLLVVVWASFDLCFTFSDSVPAALACGFICSATKTKQKTQPSTHATSFSSRPRK